MLFGKTPLKMNRRENLKNMIHFLLNAVKNALFMQHIEHHETEFRVKNRK